MRCYIDSDVLIWHLRGEKKTLKFFAGLLKQEGNELWVGALQRAEVVFFMREEETKATVKFLAQFRTAPADQSVVDQAGLLFRVWNPSHATDVNDCLLAATVIQTGGILYTQNIKHYPMPEIIVRKAW